MKYIKNRKDFLNESEQYKFGCVMIEVPVSNWKEICASIDPEDIFKVEGDRSYGLEENPHITILYGLHKEVTIDQIKQVLEEFKDGIDIEIDGIGIFENKDFDVVKFNVVPTDSLQSLHNNLSELPNSNEYPEYKPHITICYTKKGTGKKYIRDWRYTVNNVNKLCYSLPNGSKEYFSV